MQNAEEITIPDEVADQQCPQCGRNLVIKQGRYGRFLACPGFPECRFTKPIVDELDVSCPICAEGKVVRRRSKRGKTFYGCSRYPECSFTSWNQPTAETCPVCGSYLVRRRTRKQGEELVCSAKQCSYSRPAVSAGVGDG